MKSIYLKNFAATATVVCTSFLIVMLAFAGLGRGYLIDEYRASMERSAEEAVRIVSAMPEDDESYEWEARMIVSVISNSTGCSIMLADTDGAVEICSDAAPVCEHMGKTLPAAFFEMAAQETQTTGATTLEGFFAEPRFITWRGITGDDGECIGYVLVSRANSGVYSSSGTFAGMVLAVALLVLVAALSISLFYSKRMAKPLDEIAECSRMFARGDFSPRVKQVEDTTDEMGSLIESFNKMADSLESAEARRSEFIANISHELRTPMTTISGFADGLLDGTIPQEESVKYLTSIRDETRRLSRLVRDMLDVSRMKANASDPSKREKFDISELLLQTMFSFETRATAKGLDVDPQLPDNSVMVYANKDAITQVIYNLIDNAVKFAHAGTCLTIRLYKENGKAYISVRDEGETIPPDDLPYIFDRFHKSDRSRSLDKTGVGLGLYLVKSIINGHDEDIGVKSENGITEFVFTLKLAE